MPPEACCFSDETHLPEEGQSEGVGDGPQDWRCASYNDFIVDTTTVAAWPIQTHCVRLAEGYLG